MYVKSTALPTSVNANDIPKDHIAIQIIIFSATVILLVLISILLFIICCKQYNNPQSRFFGRSSSFASFHDLIRSRMEDRPPTYYESQTNIAVPSSNEEPPAYDSIQNDSHSTPKLFIISTKITPCTSNDLPSEMEWTDGFVQPPCYESIDKLTTSRNN